MTTPAHRKTAIGSFMSHRVAKEAVAELRAAGFDDEEIGIVAQNRAPNHDDVLDDVVRTQMYSAEEATETGALAGAATGAGVGTLWGIAVATGALPAIGPVIAGGTLAAIVASAVTGAAVGGLGGTLIGLGFAENEIEHYEGELRFGKTIVTVYAPGRFDEAESILRRHKRDDSVEKADTVS
jgi:hypothetical protein